MNNYNYFDFVASIKTQIQSLISSEELDANSKNYNDVTETVDDLIRADMPYHYADVLELVKGNLEILEQSPMDSSSFFVT